MRCPYCQSEETQVKDSRAAEDGAVILWWSFYHL